MSSDPPPRAEAVAFYLTQTPDVRLSSSDEEMYIAQSRQQGAQHETASVRLLEAHLRLVVSIAEQYQDRGVHVLDLIQRGNEALLTALEDLAQGDAVRFEPIARQHIERAIQRAVDEAP